jgi:hypothetical protein
VLRRIFGPKKEETKGIIRMENMRNAYKILIGKPERKVLLARQFR